MTTKENYLAALRHESHDWVPCHLTDTAPVGFAALNGPWFEKGPQGGGYDGFGTRWIAPASGGGAAIPVTGEYILDDITKWKEKVKFPDLDEFDFAADAQRFLGDVDRNEKVVDFGSGNGPFERLAALMGFENALFSMAVEPEATKDLLIAITDYKLKVIERVHKFYRPDLFTNYDDIATELSPFMSKETYRELIKPCHTRINKACRDLGIYPVQHTCGKCDSLVEEFIDTGVQAWTSVQPINDIEGVLQKYGDRLAIIGGYDTNGAPGRTKDTAKIAAEVRRCIDTYGKYNSYIFFGFIIVNSLDPKDLEPLFGAMVRECVTYSHQVAGK